jgi:hypothetical protein
MSLLDACKREIAAIGGIQVLLPLLAARTNAVRWAAREVSLHSGCPFLVLCRSLIFCDQQARQAAAQEVSFNTVTPCGVLQDGASAVISECQRRLPSGLLQFDFCYAQHLSCLECTSRRILTWGYSNCCVPARCIMCKTSTPWLPAQVLLNMAMLPEVAEQLERGGAPTYIHGMNLLRAAGGHRTRESGGVPSPPPSLLLLGRQLAEALLQVGYQTACAGRGIITMARTLHEWLAQALAGHYLLC